MRRQPVTVHTRAFQEILLANFIWGEIMYRMKDFGIARKEPFKRAALAVLFSLSGISTAQAVTVFSDTFQGYTSFPNQDPFFDPINAGIPKKSEGAAEVWYGARFEDPTPSTFPQTINDDLAVQRYGGGTNDSHTGRVEDDAGLVFKLNTTGLDAITLSFDWRTFLAGTTDRFVVGYHVGPIAGFGACTGEGEPGCFADLRTTLPWYTTQTGTTLTGNWSQLLRNTQSNAWKGESFLLPDAVENQSEVWFAFWIDNGEGDYAKIDNILVSAVPEVDAYAMMLAGLGLIGFTVYRRRTV